MNDSRLAISDERLARFVSESNAIENDVGEHISKQELRWLRGFLDLDEFTIIDLNALQAVIAPGKGLRDRVDMPCVVIRGHHAPPSGTLVARDLNVLLDLIKFESRRPSLSCSRLEMHIKFQRLHPYLDGNGRTGRALWLWGAIRTGDWMSGESLLKNLYFAALRFGRVEEPAP